METRQYQKDSISLLRDALSTGMKRVIIDLATGGGKSHICELIIRGALEKKKKVLFLVNRVQLVDQMCEHLSKAKINYGVVQGGNTRNLFYDCIIGSIDTINARGYPEVDLIIIDEAHNAASSKKYLKLIEHYQDKVIVGVTATSFVKGLGKKYSFGKLFEKIVRAVTIPELIEKGYLVDIDIYAPTEPDLSKVKLIAGDYDEKALSTAMDKPMLIGEIIKHWKKMGVDKQTIVFAVDIAHSQHICESFNKIGVKAVHIDYKMTYEEKKQIVSQFRNGEFKILCNCTLVAEGFDAPATEVMILARPTKSLKRYMQMVGRVLRSSKGKKKAILLDHSGSTRELGYPTDFREIVLDDGTPKKNGTKAKDKELPVLMKCSNCSYLRKKAGKCPVCGFAPVRQSGVGTVDGNLKLLAKKKPVTKKEAIEEYGKQKLYSELLYVANERGYKDGWAAHQFKAIFKIFPYDLANKPEKPSQIVIDYITHSLIKYRKGQKYAKNLYGRKW